MRSPSTTTAGIAHDAEHPAPRCVVRDELADAVDEHYVPRHRDAHAALGGHGLGLARSPRRRGGARPSRGRSSARAPPCGRRARCRRRRRPGPRGSSGRCRRRRRGGCSPRTRRWRVLTSALSSGQSAIASEPSAIASVSRYGEATLPAVEVVAADHDRRLHLAARDQLVEAQPEPVPLAVARASRSARAGPGRRRARPPCGSSARAARCRGTPRAPRGRSPRCRPGRRTAPPTGTAPCPRRTAAGCRPGRSPGYANARSNPPCSASARRLLP